MFEVQLVVLGNEVSDLGKTSFVGQPRTVPSADLVMEVNSSNLELVGGLALAS